MGMLNLRVVSCNASATGCLGGLPYVNPTVNKPMVRIGVRTSDKPLRASLQNCIRILPIRGFDTDSCTIANSI